MSASNCFPSQRVFISYRSREPDISLSKEFYQALKTAGHQPFMAGESIAIGENWAQRIDRELEQADYFILLLSEQSATSEMVIEEVRRAKELGQKHPQNKPIILPIRVNLPMSAALNYDLRGYLQRIQQKQWNSPADTETLLEEILTLMAKGEAPAATEENPDLPARETKDSPPLPVAEPELLREPGGTVSLKSNLYIERTPIEAECYQEILQPGALIRIKAPRQMGKTSLMARILNHAQQQDYYTIPLTFQRADNQIFFNLESLLRWFCEQVGRKLKRLNQLDEYWQGYSVSVKDKCNAYFEECLLEEIDAPLVLGLDEVDLVFSQANIADDFFGLLRSWYEAARYGDFSSELWEKLRVVIVYSTESYVPSNLNQSPFNVGKNVELSEFNLSQLQELARCYHLSLSEGDYQALQQMVGGHPYLVRKTFYHLYKQEVSFTDLLKTAATEQGIYTDHLRRHLLNLQLYPDLIIALRQVVMKSNPVKINSDAAFKLDSMGLVTRTNNEVIPRCDLYRLYFCDRLED